MFRDLVKFKSTIIYNSPYSPKFAAIEEVFGIIKAKLKGKTMKKSEDLIENVRNIIENISAK